LRYNIHPRTRVSDLDPDPDPGGQKLTRTIGKSKEISGFEALNVPFRGLKASLVAWASFMGL